MEGSEKKLEWDHPQVQKEIWGHLSGEISRMVELFDINRHDDIKVGIIRHIREICAGRVIPGRIPSDDELFSRVRGQSIEVAYVLLGKADAPEDEARDFHSRALDHIEGDKVNYDSVRTELFHEAIQASSTAGMFVHQGHQGIDPILWQKFAEVHVSILSRMLSAIRHDLTHWNGKEAEQRWNQVTFFRGSIPCELPEHMQAAFEDLAANFKASEVGARQWSISGAFRAAVARLIALVDRKA